MDVLRICYCYSFFIDFLDNLWFIRNNFVLEQGVRRIVFPSIDFSGQFSDFMPVFTFKSIAFSSVYDRGKRNEEYVYIHILVTKIRSKKVIHTSIPSGIRLCIPNPEKNKKLHAMQEKEKKKKSNPSISIIHASLIPEIKKVLTSSSNGMVNTTSIIMAIVKEKRFLKHARRCFGGLFWRNRRL